MDYIITHTSEKSIITDKQPDMSSPEVQELMRKYNLNKTITPPPTFSDPNKNLTFDELIQLEESKLRYEKQRAAAKKAKDDELRQIRAIHDGPIGHYERTYVKDDSGYSFEIIRVGNIPINY